MANNHYDLSSIYTAADKYTVLQLLNALLDKVKDLEITDVDVNKTDVNKFKLVFTFADNTTMETPEITLPYEIQNIEIVNGHLIFTLESGETMDAGNLGGISSLSVNNNQHLIVTYQDGTTNDLGSVIARLPNIEDADNNKRFIEGNLVPDEIAGVEYSYHKWSLSGTHLMLVAAGTIANGTTIPINAYFVRFNSVPSFIYNKIVAITSDGLGVDIKDIILYTTGWGSLETHKVRLNKQYGYLIMSSNETFTVTADKTFRIQFDLLIDSD